MVGGFERGNGSLGSIKFGEILEYLRASLLVRKDLLLVVSQLGR